MEECGTAFQSLAGTIELLRSDRGCPWDRAQSHESLKRNLIEETYEVLEAIDGVGSTGLPDELGDILVQVLFHSQIAKEAGHFTIANVISMAADKLTRRHPHVFGGAKVSGAEDVDRLWENQKKKEGAVGLPHEGIPRELPSLAYAQLMQDRVGKAGFDWGDISGVLDKLLEEAKELKEAQHREDKVAEMGDLLFTMVNLARWLGIHADDALRKANMRFQKRCTAMWNLASGRGMDFLELSLDDKEELWKEAKRLTE